MKQKPALLLFLCLALAACSKPRTTTAAADTAATGASRTATSAPGPDPTVVTESTDEGVNQRTRPLPRPPRPEYAKPDAGYPVAGAVPGKKGFVFSPYNNKVIDIRDIPPGTLVADPTFPAEEKKYFRAP